MGVPHVGHCQVAAPGVGVDSTAEVLAAQSKTSRQIASRAFRQRLARKPNWAAAKRNFTGGLELVGRMHRAGVAILAGSDSLNPYVYPGFSLHDELELLVNAGMSPLEALQCATLRAAQFIRQVDRRGTIETGKIADLVLFDRDPLADIRNTRSIRAVVLNGKLLERGALDKMLADEQALVGR
jgi:imidazolonepropionase-like amidohydrolase